jgi:peptide/nickel transport system permease protein
MVVGNWGRSLITDESVRATVEPRLGRSAIIALGGFVLALPTAVLLGVLAARRAGSAADTALSVVAIAVASLPEFVIAIAVLLLLGVILPVFPVDSTGILAGDAHGYVLPSLALAAWTAPYLFRMVRANVRDVLGASYVRSAQLRGILGWRLAVGHIAPNAALPLVSVITLSLAELLGGVIVIENVFAFPGMGQLLVDSVRGGDYPIVQAIALVIGSTFIILNALADVAVFALDPRTRVTR